MNTSFANLSTFSSANARYAIGTDGIFTDCAFRTVGSIDGVVGTDTTSYSEDEFADGTVLAVLGDAWGQIIGTDPYPILGKEQTAPTTYTVTVDDTIANGTVEADVSEAAEGETVTLEVTPASGFEIDTVSYNDGTNDTAITATEGIYSFMMPASNVTVTATFKVITEHTINWSGPADVVNTPEFDLMPYMPDDVEITGFSQVLSTIISGITPTYSTGVAKVELTTNTFEEPASGTVSATFKTEQYGDITFNINITLTGKYIVNISALPKDALYDGNAHRGYSNLSGTLTSGASYEGTYSYSYETADGTALDGAPTEVGDYKVTIAVPDDNENYKGSLTLEFSIKDASEPEASYQSEENGEWISGTLTEALTSVYEGGTVKLLKDVILTDTVTVAKNVTITSDNTDAPCTVTSETDQHEYLLKLLADVTLENIIVDGGSGDSITASRAMIEVGDGTNFGKLTLGTGAILRNNNNTTTNGAGGAVCVKLGDLVVSGGQISGNTAYSGSAIATVNNNNNVTIETGSVISGNNATNTDNSGGAIYISAGIVTMTGGEIKNNTAVNCGGAVFINKASTTSNATFKLQGGSITGNTAKYGGGIYISNAKLLKLSGGSVTGNTASSWGGGLLVAPNASVEISGSINISGNTNSSDAPGENLYLDGYEYNGINMPTVKVSKLDSTANVDMYSWLKPAAGGELLIASPADEYTLTADDLDKLSYEDTNYSLKLNDSGNVVLTNVPATVTYTVTVNTANNGTVVVNPTTAAEGDTVTLAVTPAEGYELQSLTVDGDDVTDGVNEGVYPFEMPAYDVTVTATFKEIASDADLLISSVAELEAFRDAVNGGNSYEGKVVKLTKSLDLSGVDWTPIGETGAKFKGTFDGGYHVIDGLTIESEAGFTGFFGRVEDATIKNLGIVNAVVSSSDYDTAILAANTIGGSIENCFVTGKASGYAGVGGIIGSTHGSSNPTTVKNCYVRATLEYADARGDCAGIAGWNYSGSIKIINSYSACIGEVRPIAGWSDGADVANSNFENVYFDKDLSPDFSSTAGRTDLGRTSEELQNESTFENYDFTNIWDIDPDINGGYPYLLGFDNVVLSGAPGTFTVILTDENGVAVTDVDVVITSDSATITLVHQGNGIYSASVPNEEAEYSINVNSDELATASHNGTETLVLEYQVASSTPTEYTVTFMDGGEVFTTITVPEGGTLAMTGMPIPDMPAGATLFGGWYTEDGDFVYHGMTVTSDMTAYPTWIAVETDGNGTVSVQRDSSDLSQMIITATPNGGYALDILAVEDADGGNIDVSDNKFTKPASDITIKVTFKTSHAHPVCGTSCDHSGSDAHESVTWTAWESTDSMPSTAGNYYLTANVTVSAEWTVPSGETLICLNGKTLKTTKINISDGNTLSVSDCGAGAVTSNGGYGASRPIVANDGTFCLYGGSITGNTNWYGQGGGVVNNGTFNMYGGSITRNSTDVSYAGGVLNNSGAIFNMYGGSITKNSAGGSGGGLYNSGKFNMYGGEITENTANVSSYGGVYSAGSINISGKVVISGNKNADGDPSNYCLPNSGAVMVVGTLESGSSIGVTHFQKVGTITTGGADYIDYFFSDNEQYFVEKDGDNLKLSEKVFTVTVTSNNTQYGTASANKASGVKGTFVTLSATPADGYRLKEWQVVSGGVTVSSSNTFVIGTADVEIMAIFEEASVITVTADPTEGGTVAGGGTYEKNTSVTVTATANDGYKFVGWYENGNEVSTAASYTFTATEARELTAKFVKLYTVTYHINNGTDEATVKTYADGDEITLPGDTFT